MYKSVASQAKFAVAVELPHSSIGGPFRVCVFLTREIRFHLRACRFFGLMLTLRLTEKLPFWLAVSTVFFAI